MRASIARWLLAVPLAGACAARPAPAAVDAGARDGGAIDAAPDRPDAGPDAAGPAACAVSGAPGTCLATAACAAAGDHTSYPGYCPGAADIQCCIQTPSVADNPPAPAGYHLMAQVQVTADMTAWAIAILHDPVTYPMFATATMTFGAQPVLARVEWHPPDVNNGVVHRGVTLYVPD